MRLRTTAFTTLLQHSAFVDDPSVDIFGGLRRGKRLGLYRICISGVQRYIKELWAAKGDVSLEL
jgi:hypothetical protein